jgi:hypothetical protein
MNKKLFKGTISVMLLLVAASLNAQNFSKSFNLDLPLAYWNAIYILESPTARQLFYANNFKNTADERAVCESKYISNGILTATLLYSKSGKKLFRVKVLMQSDSFSSQNFITYMYVANLQTGKTIESKYEGYKTTAKAESAGQLLGIFGELVVKTMYDEKKLYAKQLAEKEKKKAETEKREAEQEKLEAEQNSIRKAEEWKATQEANRIEIQKAIKD